MATTYVHSSFLSNSYRANVSSPFALFNSPFSPLELTNYRIAASIDPSIFPIIHPEHFSIGLEIDGILRMLGMPVEGEEGVEKRQEREERSVSET